MVVYPLDLVADCSTSVVRSNILTRLNSSALLRLAPQVPRPFFGFRSMPCTAPRRQLCCSLHLGRDMSSNKSSSFRCIFLSRSENQQYLIFESPFFFRLPFCDSSFSNLWRRHANLTSGGPAVCQCQAEAGPAGFPAGPRSTLAAQT